MTFIVEWTEGMLQEGKLLNQVKEKLKKNVIALVFGKYHRYHLTNPKAGNMVIYC